MNTKKGLYLGKDLRNKNADVYLPTTSLNRHAHFVGASGAGKTVALMVMLQKIMMAAINKSCVFILDGLGGLSNDLLHWMTTLNCPEHVRRRLVYVEPANKNVVTTMNPLKRAKGDSLYYHVARTVDLILRSWVAQDLGQQPRLMQWAYATLAAIASLGIPISMSQYLLRPGSPEHEALLRLLPEAVRYRWLEILNARGGESIKILESTRNRFEPIYEAPQTRRLFGTMENRFDIERMIRERRIVVVNLAGLGELSGFLSNTIGAMVLNEVFETAFRMATLFGRRAVDPTYVILDEFQRFANSPDIMAAIPTVRQVGLKLALAHQSFSQLEQGDIDLTELIWQAQNRFAFANSAADADIVANELAVVSFDSMKIKHQTQTIRQRVAGHRIVWLESVGMTSSDGEGFSEQNTIGYGSSAGINESSDSDRMTTSSGTSENRGSSAGRSRTSATGRSATSAQSLLPILEDVTDISGVQFRSFEEHRLEWMKIVRQLKTGQCIAKLVDDDHLYHLLVHYVPPKRLLRIRDRIAELKQRNYEQDFFVSSAEADRLMEQARQQLLQRPRITMTEPATFQSAPEANGNAADAGTSSEEPSPSPFRKPRKKD